MHNIQHSFFHPHFLNDSGQKTYKKTIFSTPSRKLCLHNRQVSRLNFILLFTFSYQIGTMVSEFRPYHGCWGSWRCSLPFLVRYFHTPVMLFFIHSLLIIKATRSSVYSKYCFPSSHCCHICQLPEFPAGKKKHPCLRDAISSIPHQRKSCNYACPFWSYTWRCRPFETAPDRYCRAPENKWHQCWAWCAV